MKISLAVILIGAFLALAGCSQGTSGGPGVSDPASKDNRMGQAEDTFSLDTPSTKLNQGETKTVSIGITRGKNFSEDVSVKLGELPKGVMLHTARPVIKHGDTEAKIELMAAADAAVGEFTVSVTGHPTKGGDAVTEMTISVAKQEPEDAPNAAAKAMKQKWDEYTAAMQTQLDQFSAKYEELKERAANAEGQAKIDLDQKVVEAKVKLDAAVVKLDELKSASADHWEKIKEGVSAAFEDLKKIFE